MPYFETTDCTGSPYGSGYLTSVADHTAYVGKGSTLFIGPADGSAPAGTPMEMHSRWIADTPGGEMRCERVMIASAWVPLREIAKLDDTFDPPFNLGPPTRLRSARH
jgi:hypothetical protein